MLFLLVFVFSACNVAISVVHGTEILLLATSPQLADACNPDPYKTNLYWEVPNMKDSWLLAGAYQETRSIFALVLLTRGILSQAESVWSKQGARASFHPTYSLRGHKSFQAAAAVVLTRVGPRLATLFNAIGIKIPPSSYLEVPKPHFFHGNGSHLLSLSATIHAYF